MKKCKSCQKEIDNKATKCAHCRADQRGWFRRHPILTGIIVLFVIGMIGSIAGGGSKNTSTNSGSSTTGIKATDVTYKVSDVVKTGKFELIVNSVEERSVVGSQYFEKKPSKDGTFVAVQYQYKNVTDKPVGSFSTPTIKLVDKNGTEYSADAGASGNFATELNLDRKFLSDLNPGITVNDAAIFEVSKEQYANQGWSLMIKADKDIKVLIK
jgi:hypothetical protein